MFSNNMCSEPMPELKLTTEALKQNPGARMQHFKSKQLAQKFVAGKAPPTSKFYVAVFDGYASLCANLAQEQAESAQGAHDIVPFPSRKQTQQFLDAGQQWWMVWSGTSTGVMSEDRCVDAKCNHHAPSMQGMHKKCDALKAAVLTYPPQGHRRTRRNRRYIQLGTKMSTQLVRPSDRVYRRRNRLRHLGRWRHRQSRSGYRQRLTERASYTP